MLSFVNWMLHYKESLRTWLLEFVIKTLLGLTAKQTALVQSHLDTSSPGFDLRDFVQSKMSATKDRVSTVISQSILSPRPNNLSRYIHLVETDICPCPILRVQCQVGMLH